MRIETIAVFLLCTGCAAHKPVPQNWRFVKTDTSQVLIPPGVARPDVARRAFTIDVAAGDGDCPPTVRVKKQKIFVTISRDGLIDAPTGWLTTWSAALEAQRCIAPGEAPKFAARIADSFPLDPNTAFHILYPNDVIPPMRLQVVSPILRDGAAADAQIIESSGDGNALTLTVKASDNLIGYETALYAVQPRTSSAGSAIVPLYAERHTQQSTERNSQPAANYFQFRPDAAFYRLFVKSGQTDFTALVIAAPTRAELEHLSKVLDEGAASCQKLPSGSCIAIPRRVALNSVVPVIMNGAEVMVRWGADLAEAIRGSGERQPEAVLPRLTVNRLYHGRSTPVDFDHSNPAILRLILTGGETIAWSRVEAARK